MNNQPDPNQIPTLPKPEMDINFQPDPQPNPIPPQQPPQPTPQPPQFNQPQPLPPSPQNQQPSALTQTSTPQNQPPQPTTYTQTTPVTTQSSYAEQFLDKINTTNVKPKTKFPKLTKPMLVLIGLGGLLILALIGLLVFARPQKVSSNDLNVALLARVKAANSLSTEYYSKIRNSQLKTANANTQQALSGLTNDMTEYSIEIANKAAAEAAKETKTKPKVVTKINVDAESTEEITKKLDEAVLAGTLDRNYRNEISHIVDQTLLLMNRLDQQTQDQKLKEIIKTNRENIEITQKAMHEVDLNYD